MNQLLKNKRWQQTLGALTALYFALVIVHLSPKSEWKTRVFAPIEGVWSFWRLDQNWALFSPAIRELNYHTTAVITFEDGTRLLYELPRMNKLSLEGRFRDEKWRKWAVDSLPWEDYKQFWPDFAKWLGRHYYNPQNKPAMMSLHLWFTDIPSPTVNVSQSNLPFQNDFNCVFVYRYTPEDFK